MTAPDRRLNVLIVEDSEDDALLMVRELKKGGYQTEWQRVETAQTMAAALSEKKWDVILSDYRLPHFDAPAALALLQNTGQDLPFIVISGTVGEETAVDLMKAGAGDFLLKASLVRLVPAIQREMREARNRQRRILAEETLREERKRLNMIIQGSRLGTWIWNIQSNEMIYNEQWAMILGYTLEEVSPCSYATWAKRVHPDDLSLVNEGLEQALDEEGSGYEGEFRMRHKDGTWVWILAHGRVMTRDAQGRPLAMFGTQLDITNRKLAEKELRIAHERLEVAIAGRGLGIWEWFPQGDQDKAPGTLIFNDIFQTMLGYSPGEIGHNLKDTHALTDPEELPRLHTLMRAHLNGETPYYEAVYRMRHKGGDWIWVHDRGQITARYSDGSPKRVCGTHTDVTPLLHAEQELRESEARFRSYVEQAPYGVLILDTTGSYRDANPAASQITGYDREELLTMRLGDLSPSDAQEGIAARFAHLSEQGHAEAVLPFVHKNGIRGLGHITAVRLDKERFLGFIQDITERQSLEEQLRQAQKMESVGRLAGGVAHDLNNTLSVVMGYASLGKDTLPAGKPLHDYFSEIYEAGTRSTNIVRQLLAFARKQAISPKVLDLNETIANLLKMIRRLIGEDINVTWLPGTDVWPVKMDPSQVDQILLNLCVNARDAMTESSKLIIETTNKTLDEAYCALHSGYVPGDFVQLAISDTGHGMTPEVMESIFEPFFTTKGLGQGTGLGLSTVYGIIKQNNGFINVYSKPNEGTTFKIYLPRYNGMDAKTDRDGLQKLHLSHGETILLVEDDASVLQLGEQVLKRLGYKVLSTDSTSRAIEMTLEHANEIDLLITDVIMPEMNGRELAEQIKNISPNIKILFASGHTANVIAHHGVLEEGIQFIEKPFTIDKFAKKIREVMDHSQNRSGIDSAPETSRFREAPSDSGPLPY